MTRRTVQKRPTNRNGRFAKWVPGTASDGADRNGIARPKRFQKEDHKTSKRAKVQRTNSTVDVKLNTSRNIFSLERILLFRKHSAEMCYEYLMNILLNFPFMWITGVQGQFLIFKNQS